MPIIFDNIENKFADGLSRHIDSANRVDYCVGYFNLRGWRMMSDKIDVLSGANVREGNTDILRYCRLMVGMTKSPREELFDEFTDPDDLRVDNDKANRSRKKLAIEFAEQLTIGLPTQSDEITLKKLLGQLKSGKVVVKLFLKHQLHAQYKGQRSFRPRECNN